MGLPKGLLTLDNAEISDEQMQLLEMTWRDEVAGMRSRNRIPILNAPRGGKVNFISLPAPTEMEFAKETDFIVGILCALFGMDSVNF